MIKIDLITGFLGSGKTTFIKKYAEYLMNKGYRIGILENDFGAVNVDMLLLQQLQGDNCELETVAGACDADCHKRRFKTKLIAMGMSGYDRVIVEPSGIFDTDEFFDTLREEPLDKWYEIGAVITIADAELDMELSGQSEYIFASQLANAGKIIVSKAQLVSEAQLENMLSYMKATAEKYCGRILDKEIMVKAWDMLNENDFNEISCCGYVKADFVKRFSDENSYSSLYYMHNDISTETLKEISEKIFIDPECGNIFRIKGFVKENDVWYEFNSTANNTSVSQVKNGQDIIIVIGEKLNKPMIDKYFL